MSAAQLRNLGLYALWAFIGATVATGLHLSQLLAGSEVIPIRGLAATFTASFFGALATVVGTSQLTRFGSEQIAAQVNALKTQGVPRSEMVVLSEADAASVLAQQVPPDQVAQIVAAVKAEMIRDPEGDDPGLLSGPPRFLDRAEHPAREGRG
jgi:hypothetical protein